jgi:hypothetical protein
MVISATPQVCPIPGLRGSHTEDPFGCGVSGQAHQPRWAPQATRRAARATKARNVKPVRSGVVPHSSAVPPQISQIWMLRLAHYWGSLWRPWAARLVKLAERSQLTVAAAQAWQFPRPPRNWLPRLA